MGDDEAALLRLWREKRGEIEPEDLSGNLVVQLGLATEDLNRRWYEANTGQVLTDAQQQVRHPALRWMAATLDGRVAPGSPRRPALLGRSGGVFVLSREPNALEVLDRRKPQERKRRPPLAGGSFGELVRASRIAQRD